MRARQPGSFRDHLGEIRRRLIYIMLTLGVTVVLAFIFYRPILNALLVPARPAIDAVGGKFVVTEVTELFGVTMKVSVLVGLVGALPVILYHIITFVAPGLTLKERRYLFTLLPGVLLAFASGVAFGYFVLVPPAVRFLVTWGSDIGITPFIRIGNYINLVVMLLFWIGVSFETPLVMYMLGRLGIVTHRGFARFRRYWFVVAFILGALITPTFDPLNQTLVAAPLIVLYEFGIWLAWIAGKQRAPQPITLPEVTQTR